MNLDYSQADVYFWFVMNGLFLLWPYVVIGFVLSLIKGLFYGRN